MKPETHVWIHLPNGEKFEVDRKDKNFEYLSDDDIKELQNLFDGKKNRWYSDRCSH